MQRLPNNPDLEKLQDVFQRFPGVEAVFVFGSTDTAREHQESDLDLGVDGAIHYLRAQRLTMLTELARIGFGRVDLVFLREAPPALAHQIVKNNHVIYRREDVDIGTIFSNVVRRFLDFRPYLRYQAQAYKERVLNMV